MADNTANINSNEQAFIDAENNYKNTLQDFCKKVSINYDELGLIGLDESGNPIYSDSASQGLIKKLNTLLKLDSASNAKLQGYQQEAANVFSEQIQSNDDDDEEDEEDEVYDYDDDYDDDDDDDDDDGNYNTYVPNSFGDDDIQKLYEITDEYKEEYEKFCKENNINTNKLKLVGLDSNGNPVFNPCDKKQLEKYNKKAKADQDYQKTQKANSDSYQSTYKNALSNSLKNDNSFQNPSINQAPSLSDIVKGASAGTAISSSEAAWAAANEVKKAAQEAADEEIAALTAGNTTPLNAMLYSAWDPRLKRFDKFIMEGDDINSGLVIPFASDTIAAAFSDQTYNLEKIMAKRMVQNASSGLPDYDIGHMTFDDPADEGMPTRETSETVKAANLNQNKGTDAFYNSTKLIASNTTEFKYAGENYGSRSLMNQYAITKLMGGIGTVIPGSFALNYMYDIRDRRRFYDLTVEQQAGVNDPLTISNPTTSNIIKWSNADRWARTPYQFSDFVFNKWFGLIPNNRLITFRRYQIPTRDNLNFDTMYGDIETPGKDASTGLNTKESRVNQKNSEGQGVFTPYATVVSYFGGETGNTLSSFMNFVTGTKWKDLESKIHTVSGNEGTDPQQTIDGMFEGNGFGTAENGLVNTMLNTLSTVSSKIMSFGKFALASNGAVGQSEAVMQKTYDAQTDPYTDGPYQNRIIGPINRIESIKARDAGIEFEQSFTLKVSYVAKSIGGINPKAALLDCLGNAMEMCSPTAVFWGGGHRFEITPHTYPYHDGGWRDSFMKKLYDGKFLGKDGAIAMVGSGIKKFATDDSGNFNIDKLTSSITGGIGSIMGAISAGLSALGSSIGIGGLSDVLSAASSLLGNGGEKIGGKDSVSNGAKMFKNLSNNVSAMWHDKCLQQTTFPQIRGMGSLLIGEPVGEWHLTVGNPLNPIMVCGNLICSKMQVEWDEELGPDDFPIGFTATYTIEHGMPRDKEAIQSMFNRGAGKIYALPDYIRLSSDMETKVDVYTGGSTGHTGNLAYMNAGAIRGLASKQGVQASGYHTTNIQGGKTPSNHGNPSTTMITKFTPGMTNANRTLGDIRSKVFSTVANLPVSQANLATRKWIS